MDNTVIEEAMSTAGTGDGDRALRLLVRELDRHPENVDAVLALWALSRQVGKPEVAAPHILRVLENAARSGER